MEQKLNYIEINRKAWNDKTKVHIASGFYDNQNFLDGKCSLNTIELALLGDVNGKTVLHLQCHFGQDSISLSRRGAKVTGVDLSEEAIRNARAFAVQTGTDTRFICCNIYDLPTHLDEQFDIVYTSYGTIGWLPDLDAWAKIVSRYLKPGGLFVFVEFHPVMWMFDNDFKEIKYNYFNEEAIIETETGTYADKDAGLIQQTVTWNHHAGEVLNSLLHNGLVLKSFDEFDYSPYNCFDHMVESEPGKFRIRHMGNKIPMVYAVTAIRP